MDGDQSNRDAPQAGAWLAYAPLVWLVVVLILSLRGLVLSFPVLSEEALPADIRGFVFASMASSVVTVLWGLFVLTRARSPRFAGAFAAWQIAVLVMLGARELYVIAAPAFVFSLASHVLPAVEAAIGVACLILVRRGQPAEAAPSVQAHRPPSVVAVVIWALLGVIAGAAVGLGAGLLLGVVISEATHMSCFEGACGYFAVAIGGLGLLVGAIAGGVLAVWLARRRGKLSA